MVEAGEDLRLPREPGEPVWVSREGVGQDLQRNLAVELRVGGLPDLAHAAFPEEGGDVVIPEAGAGGQRHGGLEPGPLYGVGAAGFDEYPRLFFTNIRCRRDGRVVRRSGRAPARNVWIRSGTDVLSRVGAVNRLNQARVSLPPTAAKASGRTWTVQT